MTDFRTPGGLHALRSLCATAKPHRHVYEHDDRDHGPDGAGLGLALLWLAFCVAGGLVWWFWPVVAGVLRVIGL